MSDPTGTFFVTGGTLRHDAPSYVERQADKDLYDGLLRGEFCYVLTSRQMGKSSLMVRTTTKLRVQGMRVAILDLTAIGQNLTAEQWYDGLASKLGQQLNLEDELFDFWQANQKWGPLQRWISALERVVLPTLKEKVASPNQSAGASESVPPAADGGRTPAASRLVIFIDEIDVVRSLPFPTDEFFAAIRECYNRGPHDMEFQRITFCLLGVATPSELMRDPRMTPFNIGRRIELNDFTSDEASPLAKGLGKTEHVAKVMLERVFHWTHGHPYLTQRLCRAVAFDLKLKTLDDVDRLCEELFLSPRARERDDNLLFVRERLLRTEADLASVLSLYHEVRNAKRIRDDESNVVINQLRLAGITRVEKGALKVRNAIYQQVFDDPWIQQNLPAPDQEGVRIEEFQRKHRVGLLTLLFTGIADPGRLVEEYGEAEAMALTQRHHSIVREVLRQFKNAEEMDFSNDSFLIVFPKPSEAVKFSLLLQSSIWTLANETSHAILNRTGIHIGELSLEEREGSPRTKDLYRLQIDTCSRVMSLAEGNQILLTRSPFDHARQVFKRQDFTGKKSLLWANHGSYLVKGVEDPIEICEVGEAGLALLKPPRDSHKAQRYSTPDHEPILGWRPAVGQAIPNSRWILEQKLGEGGFGEVWLGQDETLKHKRRVFKFCFRADRARSLKREVTLFRMLREKMGENPHVVRIHEIYFDEPPYYIGMDYVEGGDLRSWWETMGGSRNVPLQTRLEIVAQIAEALNAAHVAGVVHRDVKPSNILIEMAARPGDRPEAIGDRRKKPDRTPPSDPIDQRLSPIALTAKLTDFGVGQVVNQEALAGLAKMGFTQTMLSPSLSAQAGTYIYMAPELFAGGQASPQSDIYSLGVVLYQLLVGDLSRPVTMDWLVEDPLLREDLKRCFATDVQERFATAEQLAQRLRTLEKRRVTKKKQDAELAARHRTAIRLAVLRKAGVVLFWAGIALTTGWVVWNFF